MDCLYRAGLQRLCLPGVRDSSALDICVSASRLHQEVPRRQISTLAGILVSLLVAGTSLFAQTTSGIVGRVADQQGLPIAAAEVRIQSEETGSETRSTTDSNGNFAILGLPPCVYGVNAAASTRAQRYGHGHRNVGRDSARYKHQRYCELTATKSVLRPPIAPRDSHFPRSSKTR